ncbi:MAG: transketolase, partial [Methyloceanibacter sp.]|nr:transketolase [Methyloceanibacter sp.]
NLNVMRPADSVECAECWELALLAKDTPTILALTRQGVPLLRTISTKENLSAKGAYVLIEPKAGRDVTLIGTGSELSLAVEAARSLEGDGIKAAVVSMPCFELFAAQDESYRNAVLGSAPRVAVEAAVEFGWDKWLGPDGTFVGMRGFGASAPAQDLYKHFGITTDAVAAAARDLVRKTKKVG